MRETGWPARRERENTRTKGPRDRIRHAMPNVFKRLTRQPPTLNHNPVENQFTEALAAVLEANPKAAIKWVKFLWKDEDTFDIQDEDDVRVQTQKSVRDQVQGATTKFVDLEICGLRQGRQAWTLWVEVKLDADLTWSRDENDKYLPQIDHYLKILKSQHDEPRCLALVARRFKPEMIEGHQEIVFSTWSDAARVFRKSLSDMGDAKCTELLAQFLGWTKERGWTMESEVTPGELAALSKGVYLDARHKLNQAIEGAVNRFVALHKDLTVPKPNTHREANASEWESNRFTVGFTLREDARLRIHIGFAFDNSEYPHACCWVTRNPKYAALVDDYRVRTRDFLKNAGEQRWTSGIKTRGEWWLLSREKPIVEFLSADEHVYKISEFFSESLDQLFHAGLFVD